MDVKAGEHGTYLQAVRTAQLTHSASVTKPKTLMFKKSSDWMVGIHNSHAGEPSFDFQPKLQQSEPGFGIFLRHSNRNSG